MATRRNQRGRRGGRRAPLRKFVWARWSGQLNASGQAVTDENGPAAVNVLQQFEDAYGASIIGSTVVRARGVIYPDLEGGAAIQGRLGMCVEAREELYNLDGTPISNPEVSDSGPINSPHKDWMMYYPYFWPANVATPVSSNAMAAPTGFDVRANRKIEELGQTLHLYIDEFHLDAVAQRNGPTYVVVSLGLKLP